MSRVRILNLPNDCTEDQLKQHLLRTAPRDAPLLEITDVQFIRRPATRRDRAHQHQHQQKKQQGGGLAGSGAHKTAAAASASSAATILRMAFVGFRTSAAGHYVAQYFNNSFFHSARLRVELAKGLNDVDLTVNQQRKQQLKEEKLLKRANGLASSAEDAATARKRARDGADAVAKAEEKGAEEDTAAPSAAAATSSGLERRQRDFVEQRSKATEGPTWAAEVLLAPDAPPADTSAEATQEHAVEEEEQALAGGEGKRGSKKKKKGAAAGVSVKGSAASTTAADDAAELEQLALSRQQALGEVGDMDFLAGLGVSGSSSNGNSSSSAAAPHPHDATTVAPDDSAEEAGEDMKSSEHPDEDDGVDARTAEADAPPAKKAKTAKSTDASASAPATALSQEAQEDLARASHRIRLGNIPYISTEEHIKQFAASLVGPVDAVHIPLTKDTRQNKGAAFVRFVSAEDAVLALQRCRGAILMGRLLRVSAAEEDPHSKRVLEREAALASAGAAAGGGRAGAESLAGSSQFKKQREADRRAGEAGKGGGAAAAGQITWNTMYMNSHAAVETVAQRLGVRSEDVVGVGAKGAAVRAAIAEAYLTSEVQQVLSDEGIAFDLLEGATQNFLKARSNTTILVKNLQLKDGNDAAELTKLFVRFGVLETSAFPSAGTFALFRYSHPQDARIAFTRLSYKLFKTSPLFLEWAPVGALTEDGEGGSGEVTAAAKDLGLAGVASAEDDTPDTAMTTSAANVVVFTLFLTNVPFQTTDDELHAFLLDACPRLARSPETLIKRLALQQEQGRAFLTVADHSTMTYCVSKINGKTLAGRTLACVVSKQTTQMLQFQQQQQQQGNGAGPASDEVERRHERAGTGVKELDDDDEDADPTKTAVIARRRGENGAASSSSLAAAGPSRVPPGCDPLKLIVKNLPFEATEKDVRELFAAFSEIRTVRVPRKSHAFSSHRENNHRGFAFVEFLSEAEAARALETLKATHLYGRHLVLQYAKLDG